MSKKKREKKQRENSLEQKHQRKQIHAITKTCLYNVGTNRQTTNNMNKVMLINTKIKISVHHSNETNINRRWLRYLITYLITI
jgi:hypothetical protein